MSVSVVGARGEARNGQVRLYAEDASGRRRPLSSVTAATTAISVPIPAGTRRIGAVLRGEDDAGTLLAVAEAPVR